MSDDTMVALVVVAVAVAGVSLIAIHSAVSRFTWNKRRRQYREQLERRW